MANMDKIELTAEKVKQLEKEGCLVSNLDKEEKGEVVCKMAVRGKASKLRGILDTLMCMFSQSSGSYGKGFDTELKVTLLIEKIQDIEKKQ
jgi:hypothetical protein